MIFRRFAAAFAPNPKANATTLLTIILIGMLFTTLVSYIHTRESAEDLAVGQALQALVFLNHEIDSQFLELRLNLEQWSREDIFRLSLENSYIGLSARKAANTRLEQRTQGRNIRNIIIINATGNICASSDPSMIDTIQLADRDYFKRSMNGETVIASIAHSRSSGRPLVAISGPITSKDNTRHGVMVISVDTLHFAEKITNDIHLGKTGGAYFIDLKSGIRGYPSWAQPGQFDPGTSLDRLIKEADTKNIIRYKGQHSERMAMSTINDISGWLLIVEADASEILSPATYLATLNTVITVFILGLAALFLGALRRAMSDLKTSETRFRSLIETSPLGIATFNNKGELTYMNTRTSDILSIQEKEDNQFWMHDLEDESGNQIEPQSLPITQALNTKQTVLGWTAWRKTPYDIRQVLSINAAYIDLEKDPFVVAVIEDITEVDLARNVLEQSKEELEKLVESRTKELREANNRLLELDEMKSHFLSIVSHDLRTPLTSVLGFAKIIGREFSKKFSPLATSNAQLTKSADRIQHNLEIIDSEGKRLARLIDDLLDLSRIESGRYQWKDTQIDIKRVVEDAVTALNAALNDKPEIHLQLQLPDEHITLYMDPDRIMQILVNLLSNAIKFTEQGEVRLRIERNEEQLRISVSDTGVGISKEEAERIFERFYQVGNSNLSNKPVGAGLGLSICKNIVTHYGGTIFVESHPDGGSTFIVEFPLSAITHKHTTSISQ